MRTSPRLKYPLVAGIGITKVRVATATKAANIAPSATLRAIEWYLSVAVCFSLFSRLNYNSVISEVVVIVMLWLY
jgi:hypothetical protein